MMIALLAEHPLVGFVLPYSHSDAFLKAAVLSRGGAEMRELLMNVADQNALIASLLLGASFGLIGGGYHDIHGDAMDNIVEIMSTITAFFCLVVTTANVVLSMSLHAVGGSNVR